MREAQIKTSNKKVSKMPENNPFSSRNKDTRHSGGILDIDKIIEEEKIHAHKGATSVTPEPVQPVEKLVETPVEPKFDASSLLKEDDLIEEPKLDIPDNLAVDLPMPETDLMEEAQVDDEPSIDDSQENETYEVPEPAEEVSSWRPPSRRIPRVERSDMNEEPEELENPDEALEPTDDIILNTPKRTPNRRNLWLMIGGVAVVIGLIFLIPQLINSGVIYKTDDTGTTGSSNGDSSNVTAGLSQEVGIKKVSDGLESDDPDKWEVTFTADTTDITISVDCTSKPGGGTSPNLSCVSSSSGDVIDGTFVKPFTAGEGWTYDGEDYGYCFSFADKVSAQTVQSDLYGSSGIQLFYMADDFRICSKKAGNPENVPKDTPCDNQKAYCPAVRLRSIS